MMQKKRKNTLQTLPSTSGRQREAEQSGGGGEEDHRKMEREKKRRRMDAWRQRQQLKQKQQEEEERRAVEDVEEKQGTVEEQLEGGKEDDGKKKKAWTLEDEDGFQSDEDGGGFNSKVLSLEDGKHLPRLGELGGTVKKEEEDGFDSLVGRGREKNKVEKEDAVGIAVRMTGEEGSDKEIDPLDAFMEQEVMPQVVDGAVDENREGREDEEKEEVKGRRRRRREDFDEESEEEVLSESGEEIDDEEWARRVRAGKLSKGDKMGVVDHSTMSYPPFRRNFYIEVPELQRMTDEQVAEYRKTLDGIKVRGKHVPKPIKSWIQAGLSSRILDVLKRHEFESPLPIQAQAVPVIMGGRDCIGVAKTGSGKTLAFVLPMLRHVKDQPALKTGDGPIGIIMAPTRELVTQIGKEVKRFAKPLGIRCTCVYGGSGIAAQISELKRGTEIVVCTPGRMIDILASGPGKITNLTRVTFLVMDEADRMFDMGFEPQIMRIVNNIRPDRQTVLFSATFPRSVESLARKVLTNPVEIQLGGRSVVNSDITQIIEIRPEEDRFLRLLQLLGEWYEKGKLLVFVSSQDRCDGLFRDLLKAGYPCLSLHGGKDQSDRESTISDFKSSVCNVLIATSVAARGLDVKELVLVVNYDCPNHHEEYVHRVGRTGRAGRKGTAVTFIAPDEEQYAPDLVKALKESGATIPKDLATMAQQFITKRKAGLAKAHASGFGGSGFKFSKEEEDMVKAQRKSTAAKEYGIIESSDEEDEDRVETVGPSTEVVAPQPTIDQQEEMVRCVVSIHIHFKCASYSSRLRLMQKKFDPAVQAQIKTAHAVAQKLMSGSSAAVQPPKQQPVAPPQEQPSSGAASASALAAARAAAMAASKSLALKQTAPSGPAKDIKAAAKAALEAMGAAPTTSLAGTQAAEETFYKAELEINDFPQHARWKVTHRETLRTLSEQFAASVIVKGRYVKPGTHIPADQRKLYLLIEGASPDIVKKAKNEIKRILEESTEKAFRREAPQLM